MGNVDNVGDMGNNNRIYVCQSNSCRRKGTNAALVEIEELAKLVGNCDVQTTGCLGYCSQGPAVQFFKTSKRRFHVKVNTFGRSAAVVKDATGKEPPLDNLPPETESRLSAIRVSKKREYFASTFQWNKALSGLTETLIKQARLRPTFEGILNKVGYPGTHLRDLLRPSPLFVMPASIEGYVPWKFQAVKIVSGHSVIF